MSAQIRLATLHDAPDIHAIYAPIVTETPISFELDPPSIEEMQRRIVKTLERYPWLVLEENHSILGYVYAGLHRERLAYQWSTDVSVYVHSMAHRRGIGRALYTALFELLRLQGYFNLYAGVTLPNPGSVGLHESMGFVKAGHFACEGFKFGVWRDVGWWHKALRPHDAPAHPPVRLHEVLGSEEYDACIQKGLAILRR